MLVDKAIHHWRPRHQNRTNFWLHMVGMPVCFLAAPAMAIVAQGWMAGALFVGGYALQLLGHTIEGNRSGEEMLLRKLLSRP